MFCGVSRRGPAVLGRPRCRDALVLTRLWFTNEYFFFAAYVVLQYIVLSTAWNILGGYTGYINFGTGAFFAIGAYTTVVLHNLHAKPALLQDWFGVAIRRSRCRS